MDKEEQKKLLIDVMEADEKDGLYKTNSMTISRYTHFNQISILPEIHISYENIFKDGKLSYLSLDIGWIKWGICIIFIEE